MSNPSFELKGNLISLPVLEIYHYSPEDFTLQLADKVKQAPGFFQQTAMVLSLDKLTHSAADIDFAELRQICERHGVKPIGLKSPEAIDAALRAGLAHIPSSASRQDSRRERGAKDLPIADQNSDSSRSAAGQPQEPQAGSMTLRSSRIISTPVRSGQQVYVPGADLIVLSQVSPGAEILADGNIHVYGTLRGRALAGVSGNSEARIFCQKLEAEIISINGCYKLSEDLKDNHWQKPVQAYLSDNALQIEVL